jgi:hypothetical protein
MNITTQFEGKVTVSSPLFSVRETYRVEFVSKLLPSFAHSYVIVDQQDVEAGQATTVSIYLRDEFGNKYLEVLKKFDSEH